MGPNLHLIASNGLGTNTKSGTSTGRSTRYYEYKCCTVNYLLDNTGLFLKFSLVGIYTWLYIDLQNFRIKS